MLGAIIRVLIFGAVVAALAWGATFLMENPGGIVITWGGYEYPPISSIQFVLAILAICFGLVLLFKITGLVIAFIRFLAGDDNAVRRYFDRTRERKGIDALSSAMLSLAAGDAAAARLRAERAERLLARPELTRLVNAQAAEMAGDTERARLYWRALASDPETQVIGVKGLLKQALDAGDNALAMKLAERISELRPQDGEALAVLYGLQLANRDWDGARRTVQAQRRAGTLDKAQVAAREAEVSLMEAAQADSLGEDEHARKLAIEAAKRDPGNVAAVVAAARHLTASGSHKIAARLITDAWRINPHPDLAAAYAAIEAQESAGDRLRRFERLFEANPSHEESRLLKAELALLADDPAAARRALGDLPEGAPSARTAAILAALARAEGAPEEETRGWLAQALGAAGAGAAFDRTEMLPFLIGRPPAARHVPDGPAPDAVLETPEDEAKPAA